LKKIHACKNIFVLFRGDYADLDKCPKCGYDQYKRKKDGGDDNNTDDENEPGKIRGKKKANRGAPVRVAWFFCIIPRLRKWFTTRNEAQLLHWHEEGRKKLNYKKDGKFRHPADAAQWGNNNTHFPWFDNTRSIRFAMSTNGVNPFGNQSSTHSTWPVVLSLYNLPPWLCKKQKYIMLKILVSGPKQSGDRIDVYLRQLVDDLKILWKLGVPEVWDKYKREEFTMHGMLFTTNNDNPAHCNLSVQSKRKGAACPHCLEDTCAIWLRH
jgi:Zn ribbon nucleic-acid-binding protein